MSLIPGIPSRKKASIGTFTCGMKLISEQKISMLRVFFLYVQGVFMVSPRKDNFEAVTFKVTPKTNALMVDLVRLGVFNSKSELIRTALYFMLKETAKEISELYAHYWEENENGA